MKIEGIRKRLRRGYHELCATVIWEDSARPHFDMFFAVPETAGIEPDLVVEPFVLAAFTRAFDCGESRLACSEPVADELLSNMVSALAIVKYWGDAKFAGKPIPALEVPLRSARLPRGSGVAAFYSGGVDSTHLLLTNAEENPHASAGRVTHALLVYGLDMGKSSRHDQRDVFNVFVDGSRPLLESLRIVPVPILTNLRHLDSRLRYFLELGIGFDLAACGMLFPTSISKVLLANPGEPLSQAVQAPSSAHPIVHQYLSSGSVGVSSPYVEMSRLQRIARIGKNKAASNALRVCFFGESNALNCGRCEKCVRTMLGLRVLNSVENSSFPAEVTPANIDHIEIRSDGAAAMHRELLPLLAAQGAHDLLAAEHRALARWRKIRRRQLGLDFKGLVRSVDTAWLGGSINRLRRRLRQGVLRMTGGFKSEVVRWETGK